MAVAGTHPYRVVGHGGVLPNARHKSPTWPDGYWPKNPDPPREEAWDESVKAISEYLEEMRRCLAIPSTISSLLSHGGTGQTLLREALLIADHNAYHIGQLVLVRRALGAWGDSN